MTAPLAPLPLAPSRSYLGSLLLHRLATPQLQPAAADALHALLDALAQPSERLGLRQGPAPSQHRARASAPQGHSPPPPPARASLNPHTAACSLAPSARHTAGTARPPPAASLADYATSSADRAATLAELAAPLLAAASAALEAALAAEAGPSLPPGGFGLPPAWAGAGAASGPGGGGEAACAAGGGDPDPALQVRSAAGPRRASLPAARALPLSCSSHPPLYSRCGSVCASSPPQYC